MVHATRQETKRGRSARELYESVLIAKQQQRAQAEAEASNQDDIQPENDMQDEADVWGSCSNDEQDGWGGENTDLGEEMMDYDGVVEGEEEEEVEEVRESSGDQR
ncbi:unnamed protein product [Peronospora farinosa]|uniref:Uncharacterized protein n=1 Tax=Peronospora farinosa TaxID=134698 RepID=A0AAV0TKA3_9STRA|nr:unnamed protein product [Peronospora farinosa]